MIRETLVQSQVASYQRLKKWYLIPPCLTLSNIRYVSRVKWSNSGKGVEPSPTPWCSSYWKGSLLVPLDYGRQLYLLLIKVPKIRDSYLISYSSSLHLNNYMKSHGVYEILEPLCEHIYEDTIQNYSQLNCVCQIWQQGIL